MQNIETTFPAHVLKAAPAPETCAGPADYLSHLLDQRPDLCAAALPYAGHEDLAELVTGRMWSRDSGDDLRALGCISDHPECDFWVALAILLRIFPAPGAAPEHTALAVTLVDSINAGRRPMRHSATPVITTEGLRLYESLTEGRDALRISTAIAEKARAHAAWLDRGRRADARYAMFAGTPIWAANQAGPDTRQPTTPEK
ncbi:hypothetical protein OB2597_08049 [Pseudooceanicola batsensis HTCC2597]|uniref:Uncharacterized protein n=1 Tax=Pseudooceanicola batsensis (strain ATCC BAA-863 / DSM 15984 / KCTC 12145 / HTCC2597) TaxID=252305 RepID=A3TU82_PSEBH|nr:hypothetical protein [Pseudooceanicola batsensis]EAQ04078.1 hypothetical protein OB2597_08049 [Pseudooceanicola batsensis HTCC2597]